MDETKLKIISLFKKKGSELSTEDIASGIYDEYLYLKREISSKNKKKNKKIKRKIAQLHRRILHHLNKLVELEILNITKYGEKGKKYFSLNISDNEEILAFPKYKKRIIISKPPLPVTPIEGYENQGVVAKYETATWIDRLNSLAIMCKKIDNLKELYNIITKTFSIINDALCLENFENIINKSKIEEIKDFLKKIESHCEDYGRVVSCILNISLLKKNNFLEIVEFFIKENIKNIIFIYNLDKDELQENFFFLSKIILSYLKSKKLIYFKNKKIYKAPYFIGNVGPYCFSEKEWETRTDCLILACSQSSLIVDVEKFYSLYKLDIEKFSQLMFNISKSFLSANSLQRRKCEDYFREIIALNHPYEKEFLELSRNYIRFWNFTLSRIEEKPEITQEKVLHMINEAKKKIDEFAIAEETIYKSCGMPTRFKIALACAFSKVAEKLTKPKYQKLEIKNLEELYSPKIKREIIARENVTSMFSGGNDVTIHRTGNFDPEDIVKEILIIMDNYRIPLFSYNFGKIKGDMKLDSFI